MFEDETYRRVLAINDRAVLVEVTQKKTKLDVTPSFVPVARVIDLRKLRVCATQPV